MDERRPALTRRASLRGWRAFIATALPVGFLAIFFAYPVASVIARGLDGRGRINPADVLGHATTWRVVWFTLWQAGVSTCRLTEGCSFRKKVD